MSGLYNVNCDVHSYCGNRPCPWCAAPLSSSFVPYNCEWIDKDELATLRAALREVEGLREAVREWARGRISGGKLGELLGFDADEKHALRTRHNEEGEEYEAVVAENAALRARLEDARFIAVYYATNGLTPLEGAVRECVARILDHFARLDVSGDSIGTGNARQPGAVVACDHAPAAPTCGPNCGECDDKGCYACHPSMYPAPARGTCTCQGLLSGEHLVHEAAPGQCHVKPPAPAAPTCGECGGFGRVHADGRAMSKVAQAIYKARGGDPPTDLGGDRDSITNPCPACKARP